MGSRELEGLKDEWGNAFHYYLENSQSARITSNGPDTEEQTQWDVGIRIKLKEQQKEQAKSWTQSLRPDRTWLERRKEKLGYKDELDEEEAGEFHRKFFAGGGERLEGARYYWFFTILMFITALIFIPYAWLYRGETILQE